MDFGQNIRSTYWSQNINVNSQSILGPIESISVDHRAVFNATFNGMAMDQQIRNFDGKFLNRMSPSCLQQTEDGDLYKVQCPLNLQNYALSYFCIRTTIKLSEDFRKPSADRRPK